MFNSTQNNVVFEIYGYTYDATSRRNYITSDPDLGHVYGHIQDVTQILQKYLPGNVDTDKNSRFKIFISATPVIDTKVKEGLFIRITKYKDKYTRAWREYETAREFEISKINQADYLGRGLVLSIVDKQKL